MARPRTSRRPAAVPAAHHNHVLAMATRVSLDLEEKLVVILTPVLVKAGEQAADRFDRIATKTLIASGRTVSVRRGGFAATREMAAARAEEATRQLQSATTDIEAAQVDLSDAIHAGDHDAVKAAQAKLVAAREKYNRALSSARKAKDTTPSEPVVPPNPATQQAQPAPPAPTVPPGPGVPTGVPPTPTTPPPPTGVTPESIHTAKDVSEGATQHFETKAEEAAAARGESTPGDYATGRDLSQEAARAGFVSEAEQALLNAGTGWMAPAASELVNTGALGQDIHQAIDPVSRAAATNVMRSVVDGAGQPGLSFEVTNPFAHVVLAQSASQITQISETTQADVMKVIADAHENGWSIPKTASEIRTRMTEASPARARLIARTELAGAVNGGSLAGVQIVSEATGDVYTKQWLTSPGAPNPRHEMYQGLDGQTAPLDGTFTVGADQLKFPGDPDGSPEEVCNCRCALAYLEGAQHAIQDEPTEPAPTPEPVEPAVEPVPEPEPVEPQTMGLPPNVQEDLRLSRERPQIVDQVTPEQLAHISKPFTTITDGPATEYLDGHYASWGKAITHDQTQALMAWQQTGLHFDIADYLNNGPAAFTDRLYGPDGFKGKGEPFPLTQVKKYVEGIDQAIASAPALDQGIETLVYRGTNLDQMLGKDYRVGTVAVAKNFTAVTTEQSVAEKYIDVSRPDVGLAQIELPPGDRGAWLRSPGLESADNANNELLLARDRRFVVTKVDSTSVEVNPGDYATVPIVTMRPLPEGMVPGIDVATPADQVAFGRYQADVGITPFRGAVDEPLGFYDSNRYSEFINDMHRIAPHYGVTIDGVDQSTGIWEGETEPSVAMRVHDGDLGVKAFVSDLGNSYDQYGVVVFDTAGTEDIMATFNAVVPQDKVMAALKAADLKGGRFTTDGRLQVIGKGPKFVAQLDKLDDGMGGVGYHAGYGRSTELDRGKGDYKAATDLYDRNVADAEGAARVEVVPFDRAADSAGVVPAHETGVGPDQAAAPEVTPPTEAELAHPIPVVDGTTFSEVIDNIGARDLMVDQEHRPDLFVKHPKSGYMVRNEKPAPHLATPADKSAYGQPPRIEWRRPNPKSPFLPEEVVKVEPPKYLYRAISEEDYQQSLKRGYIQSDQRMNLLQTEGTVTELTDPSFYLPGRLASDPNGHYPGRIVRIDYRDEDGWRLDTDSYIKTDKKIPISQVSAVTPIMDTVRATRVTAMGNEFPDFTDRIVRPMPLTPPLGDTVSVPKYPFVDQASLDTIDKLGIYTWDKTQAQAQDLFVKNGAWDTSHRQEHAIILERYLADKVPVPAGEKPQVYFTAGGAASGKGGTKFLMPDGSEIGSAALGARPDTVLINPDDVKEMLHDYQVRWGAGDPMAASFVHEESSYVAKLIEVEAKKRRLNIVVDQVGASEKFQQRLAQYVKDGYEKPNIVMVSIPTNQGIMRSLERGGQTGRFVQIDELKKGHAGASVQLKKWMTDPNVGAWRVYDNMVPRGQPPTLVAEGGDGKTPTIYDQDKFNAILAKADE